MRKRYSFCKKLVFMLLLASSTFIAHTPFSAETSEQLIEQLNSQNAGVVIEPVAG